MPVMNPFTSAVNLTPSSMADGSATDAFAGVAELLKPPHGQVGGGTGAAVVNDQTVLLDSALPAASLMRGSVAPPCSVAV